MAKYYVEGDEHNASDGVLEALEARMGSWLDEARRFAHAHIEDEDGNEYKIDFGYSMTITTEKVTNVA